MGLRQQAGTSTTPDPLCLHTTKSRSRKILSRKVLSDWVVDPHNFFCVTSTGRRGGRRSRRRCTIPSWSPEGGSHVGCSSRRGPRLARLGTMFRGLSLLSPRLLGSLPASPAGGQAWAARASSSGAWSGGAGLGACLRSLHVSSMTAGSQSVPSVVHTRSGGNPFVTRRSMATEAFERTKKHANIGSIGHVDHGALWAPPRSFFCGCAGFRGSLCGVLFSGASLRLGEQPSDGTQVAMACVGLDADIVALDYCRQDYADVCHY